MSSRHILRRVTTVRPWRLTQSWHSELHQSKTPPQVTCHKALAPARLVKAEGKGLQYCGPSDPSECRYNLLYTKDLRRSPEHQVRTKLHPLSDIYRTPCRTTSSRGTTAGACRHYSSGGVDRNRSGTFPVPGRLCAENDGTRPDRHLTTPGAPAEDEPTAWTSSQGLPAQIPDRRKSSALRRPAALSSTSSTTPQPSATTSIGWELRSRRPQGPRRLLPRPRWCIDGLTPIWCRCPRGSYKVCLTTWRHAGRTCPSLLRWQRPASGRGGGSRKYWGSRGIRATSSAMKSISRLWASGASRNGFASRTVSTRTC